MKKLKCVFIDAIDDRRGRKIGQEESLPPYSTFQEYAFNQYIGHRVKEVFGWTTNLLKDTQFGELEISIHVLTLNYLLRYGVAQHFYSPHGSRYDDKYSYLHGMNLLTFEGYNRVHLIYSIKRICHIFQKKMITSTKNRRRRKIVYTTKKEEVDPFYLVPVDRPRIGILTPTTNLNSAWVRRIKSHLQGTRVSDDIRDLVPEISLDNFVDFSLSRNYQYELDDYIQSLNSILETF